LGKIFNLDISKLTAKKRLPRLAKARFAMTKTQKAVIPLLDKGIQKNIGCLIRKVGHVKISKGHREKK
jgi:hypothetical protein